MAHYHICHTELHENDGKRIATAEFHRIVHKGGTRTPTNFPYEGSATFARFLTMDAPFMLLNSLMPQTLDSKIWVAELLREVHALQHTLEATLQTRRNAVEKKRKSLCYLTHEVKNALTGIVSCAEVLDTGNLTSAERTEFLQLLGAEIDRVVGMTQDLVECVDGQRNTLRLQTCSVKDFMQDFLPLIKHNFAERKITIRTDLHYTGQFQIDLGKMKQVFLNIAYNARDAMPDGGTLTITSQRIEDTIQFEFIDTGCGMSPELQMHFLEPFVTAGKPTGTGLGMAIVKEILDAHQA